MPLLILIAFLIGLAISVKRRKHGGHAFLLFMFLFWIVPYSLIGGKWLRYTLSMMPFVYMLAAVGVVALIRFTASRAFASRRAVFAFTALAPGKAGYFFPHDEFYDDGLREAIKTFAKRLRPAQRLRMKRLGRCPQKNLMCVPRRVPCTL